MGERRGVMAWRVTWDNAGRSGTVRSNTRPICHKTAKAKGEVAIMTVRHGGIRIGRIAQRYNV